jgi:histidyl-tRNA synthetase
MKIPPVKGTRDFYPPDMAVRNFIIDGWKKVSLRNGFEEYDGPIFEYLKMFQLKSGDEIAEQLFSLKDRGGRELALRPEITPTLARMVNQQISSLPKPIKWFSVPRLFRAERPQKGRLREFFQWNIDIIGVDDVLADAEVIFTTVDYLRSVGLTPKDIKVKFSSRKLLAEVLKKVGVSEEKLDSLYTILDKKSKLPPETFKQMLDEQIPDPQMAGRIQAFMETKKFSDVQNLFEDEGEIKEALDEIVMMNDLLSRMTISEHVTAGEYCVFDPSIVRGLAYYTGIVFEVYDVVGELRAICGGGRFDSLLHDFGGPSIPATGMGMGDCVLEILLRQKGLLDKQLPKGHIDYFVAFDISAVKKDDVDMPEDLPVELVAKLRSRGYSAEFSYKTPNLKVQMGEAASRNAQKCIIIGENFKNNQIIVRDMNARTQELVNIDKFFANLKSAQG